MSKLNEIEIYEVGICYMSVCAPADWDEKDVENYANILSPSGVSHRWTKADEPFADGAPNPCWCDDSDKKRKHYLLSC